jgi:hypothetical protein
MFRTDSSLKGVARREQTRPGISKSTPNSSVTTSISGSGASITGNRSDNNRDEVLEKAKAEREEREWKRQMRVHAVRIQSRWRQFRCASAWFTQELEQLNKKLDDVDKIATAFAGVGIPFVPPAETSHALLLPMTILWSQQTKKQKEASVLSIAIKRMLQLILLPSLKSSEPKLNFLSRSSLSLENIVSNLSPHLNVRIRRLMLICLEYPPNEITSSCLSGKLYSDPILVDLCLEFMEIVSVFPETSSNGTHGTSQPTPTPPPNKTSDVIAPAIRVSAIQVLRVSLIIRGGLRRVLLHLPDPKLGGAAFSASSSTSSSSGSSSDNNTRVKLGGCALVGGPIVQDRVQRVLSRLWQLSLAAIQCAPPAPRPSSLVMESFAKNILSVPLLFWREDGRDLGRLVAADMLNKGIFFFVHFFFLKCCCCYMILF